MQMSIKRVLSLCFIPLILLCASCGREPEPQTTTEAESNTVTVMFPEGSTVLQTAKLLEENGVCATDAFLEYVRAGDEILAIVPDTDARAFPAEGYLFPDTYEFYKNSSPSGAADKFLSNLDAKWTQERQARADALGMTMDEVLTLASIIQTEAGITAEMPHVSSVLHNRLNQKMMLQCDVTYYYLERTVMPYLCGEEWDDAVYEKYADRYYTYRFTGLPQGAICNPGIEAIDAALSPSDTNDLFFVTDAQGKFYYAATNAEHLRNCETARQVNAQVTAGE